MGAPGGAFPGDREDSMAPKPLTRDRAEARIAKLEAAVFPAAASYAAPETPDAEGNDQPEG